MKVKVFDGALRQELEKTIQSWLDDNPNISVQQISQSEHAGCVTVTILYTVIYVEIFD